MPGKPDAHQDNVAGQRGNYFPGSKEYRAWDDGWRRRYAEGAKAATSFTAADNPAEFEADQSGWDAANNNSTGVCRMPHACGVPTGSP